MGEEQSIVAVYVPAMPRVVALQIIIMMITIIIIPNNKEPIFVYLEIIMKIVIITLNK